MRYLIDSKINRFDEELVNECLQWIPPQQVEQIKAVHHLQGQKEKVAVYCLLTDLLKSLGETELPLIGHTEKGCPLLITHPQYHISISHCKNAVAVAIDSEKAIGIDIECRRKISDALIEKVCNDEEQESIKQSIDPEKEFIRIWTRKEAYYKCLGTGIQDSLKEVDRLAQLSNHTIESVELPYPTDGWFTICIEK